MNDLRFFYSAKMGVVFFILMLSSATLEAQQRNENDKFFEFITTIGEYFGGEFNEAGKALKLDLNGANSFLERLHKFATHKIVRKNENGQFECKKSKKSDFKMAIKTILVEKSDKDVRNLLKAIKVSNPIKTLLDEKLKPNEKLEDWLKELSEFSEEKLFNLLFSLATRLEALVHGKNCDGTLKEKEENSKDKIQTFLAVPKCFPESELSIFNYWIEIIKMKTKNRQEPIFGVAIYKKKYNVQKLENSKRNDFRLSRENYEILKQLNDQKFSIYESTTLLRDLIRLYSDRSIPKRKREVYTNLFNQIQSEYYFNLVRMNEYYGKTYNCAFAMLFQNMSKGLMKMMSDKGIDPKFHLDSIDFKIQKDVQEDVEHCKTFENDNEDAEIIFLNNVHYELSINFEFNQRNDVYDRTEDLLSDWDGRICKLSEKSYLKNNSFNMLGRIEDFTSEKTNREAISTIEALIGKENIDQFNLGSLFDQMKLLVKVAIPEEADKFWKAKKKINIKQLENDIEFLKKNPKSIVEEKYNKAIAIICTIKEYGEKVKMQKSKIKTIEIKEQFVELTSKIQNTEKKYFGIELWEQMKKSCNQLKPKQIQMEENEIVSEGFLLKNLQFEFDELKESFEGGWRKIEEYYLKIPFMQLEEQALTLAKTFGKMLENVKEHYAE